MRSPSSKITYTAYISFLRINISISKHWGFKWNLIGLHGFWSWIRFPNLGVLLQVPTYISRTAGYIIIYNNNPYTLRLKIIVLNKKTFLKNKKWKWIFSMGTECLLGKSITVYTFTKLLHVFLRYSKRYSKIWVDII